MDNIETFNQIVGLVLADLYKSFPVPIDIPAASYAKGGLGLVCLGVQVGGSERLGLDVREPAHRHRPAGLSGLLVGVGESAGHGVLKFQLAFPVGWPDPSFAPTGGENLGPDGA
jgi:hypothetical protein